MSSPPATVREYRVRQPSRAQWWLVEGAGDWLQFRVVHGSSIDPERRWTRIARFLTEPEARGYVTDVRARQAAILAGG